MTAELVASLPVEMSVASGLNAMAHAVEALYAQNRNPLSTVMAVEGLSAFVSALPKVLEQPEDLQARGETLYAAWLCGMVLGQVGMALHHKLCHTLGGSFELPHAETHAVILPHAVAFNEKAAVAELQPLSDIFEGEQPGAALYDFAKSIGAPLCLTDIGFDETNIAKAAKIATSKPYWNPRPFDTDKLTQVLHDATVGQRPN